MDDDVIGDDIIEGVRCVVVERIIRTRKYAFRCASCHEINTATMQEVVMCNTCGKYICPECRHYVDRMIYCRKHIMPYLLRTKLEMT